MIRHHLADDLVVSYAAGALAEGWSLVVAAHLALCPLCRRRCAIGDNIGGLLLEELAPDAPPEQSWEEVRARLAGATPPVGARDGLAASRVGLPEPVKSYVRRDAGSRKWAAFGRRAYQIPIPTADGSTRARLLRIPAGRSVPEHGHRGRELTLVLSGILCDDPAIFRRGDILDADEALTHKPVAGVGADCICLVVTDAPLRFRSRLIRLVQPLLGI